MSLMRIRLLKFKWTEHLRNNGMDYGSHFIFASRYGLRCLKAGVYLLIHSVLPCFYRRAGSMLVAEMSKDFFEHRIEKKSNVKQTTKR